MFILDTDKKAFADSKWASFEEAKFLIAPTSNLAFQRTFARLQAPFRKKLEKGSLDPKISQQISCEAIADSLLLDWKDVFSPDGKAVAFNKELAQKLLIQRPDIREFVMEFALELENFKVENVKEMGED